MHDVTFSVGTFTKRCAAFRQRGNSERRVLEERERGSQKGEGVREASESEGRGSRGEGRDEGGGARESGGETRRVRKLLESQTAPDMMNVFCRTMY